MKTPFIRKKPFKRSALSAAIFLLMFPVSVWAEEEIQFNTDVLDTQDKNNIDLSHFSRRGYVHLHDYGE